MRSIPLLRPVRISHARGFLGRPWRGHCSSAAAKASCRASSARSKSPRRRISVARTRPASSVNKASTMSSKGAAPIRSESGFAEDPDRPNLDAPVLRTWNFRAYRERLVEVFGFHQIVAAELLTRLGEGTVGDQRLSIAHPDGGCHRNRSQPVSGLELPCLHDRFGEFRILLTQLAQGRR